MIPVPRPKPTPPVLIPSGPEWQKLFPTSVSLDDLTPAFCARVKAMLASLTEGGATFKINATWRPTERAYLMHYCCMIADTGLNPDDVPGKEGVLIDWTHGGNYKKAKAAAVAMKLAYNIAYPAALVSRHTQGRAIDMIINIPKRPKEITKFVGGDGKSWVVGAGDLPALYKFGASFKVYKLVKDFPHWSDDGH